MKKLEMGGKLRDKGRYYWICLGILFIVFASVFSESASAESFSFRVAREQVGKIIDSALGIMSPVFEYIIGDYQSSDFFFHKILLFFLLLIISKFILDKTPIGESNKKVSFLVSLIVSILGIRFINQNDFFESIFIQYGVLGIAISSLFPMVIFFYFVHHMRVGAFGRKMFWFFYMVVMTAIWIVKSSEIPEVAHWIYGITVGASLLFILADRSIHSYFGMSEFNVFERMAKKKRIRELKKDLDTLLQELRTGIIELPEYRTYKNSIDERIRELSRD